MPVLGSGHPAKVIRGTCRNASINCPFVVKASRTSRAAGLCGVPCWAPAPVRSETVSGTDAAAAAREYTKQAWKPSFGWENGETDGSASGVIWPDMTCADLDFPAICAENDQRSGALKRAVIAVSSGILCEQVAAALGLVAVRHSLINKGVTDRRRPHGRMCNIRPIPPIAPRGVDVPRERSADVGTLPCLHQSASRVPPRAVSRAQACRTPDTTGHSGPSADLPHAARSAPAPLARDCRRRRTEAEPSASFRLTW